MKLSTLTRSLLAVVLCAAALPAQAQFGGVRNLIQDVQRATQPAAPPAMPSEGGGMPPAAPAAVPNAGATPVAAPGAAAPAGTAPGAAPASAGGHDLAAWTHGLPPAAQRTPYVVLPLLRFEAFTNPCASGGGRCWVPQVYLPLVGALPSSGGAIVSYSHGGKPWFSEKFTSKDAMYVARTFGPHGIQRYANHLSADRNLGARHTGRIDFKVEIRDALNNHTQEIFKGHFIAGKVHTGIGPKGANDFDYYVDHDWATEVMVVDFLGPRGNSGDFPTLWVSGVILQPREQNESFSAHLLRDGVEVASTTDVGWGWSAEARSTQTKSGYTAKQIRISFASVVAYTKRAPNPKLYVLSDNPGAYTVKLLRNGELAREIAFRINGDGKIDRTMNAAGNVAHGYTLVPTRVSKGDGKKRDSYDSEGFYGNPVPRS